MNKTILILGGFGFIGTNLIKFVDKYLFEQYKIIVFDRAEKHPYGVEFKSVIGTYAGDFSNIEDLERIFRNEHIDLVIHSLSSTVPSTSLNFVFDIESNLVPTVQLLRLLGKYNVKNLIYFSSGGAIYGVEKGNHVTHVESEIANPISSYGITKRTIENYISLFHRTEGMNSLILRLSNPYGPYHYSMKQGIINIALRRALMNEEFSIWGNGEGVKDYIYIDDVAKILFLLLGKGIWNEVVNIGSGHVHSLNEIIHHISVIHPAFEWNYIEQNKYDVTTFLLNINKLLGICGNEFHFTSIEDGISKTNNWILNGSIL